jgi:hypothetical protein
MSNPLQGNKPVSIDAVERRGFQIFKWCVRKGVASIALTVVLATVFGALSGAYVEFLFHDWAMAKSWREVMEGSLDFAKPRLYYAYYGDLAPGGQKSSIVGAELSLNVLPRSNKITGVHRHTAIDKVSAVTGFMNGTHMVLSRQGQTDIRGQAAYLLASLRDEANRDVYVGYYITEDDGLSAITSFSKCPFLMIDDSTFAAYRRDHERVRNAYASILAEPCIEVKLQTLASTAKRP